MISRKRESPFEGFEKTRLRVYDLLLGSNWFTQGGWCAVDINSHGHEAIILEVSC